MNRAPEPPFPSNLFMAAQRQDHPATLQALRDLRSTIGIVIKPEALNHPAFDAFKSSAEFFDWQVEAGQ